MNESEKALFRRLQRIVDFIYSMLEAKRTAEEKHYLAKEYNVNKRVIKLFQYNPSTTKKLTNMTAVFILRAQDSFAAPILSLSA